MEQATSIHPLCRLAIDPAGRTGGPTAIAHHAQRGHTRVLFAENTKTCPVGAKGASHPTRGALLACEDRVGYTQSVARIVVLHGRHTRPYSPKRRN